MSFTIDMLDGSKHQIDAGNEYETSVWRNRVVINHVNLNKGLVDYTVYETSGTNVHYKYQSVNNVADNIIAGLWIPISIGIASWLATAADTQGPISTLCPLLTPPAPKPPEQDIYCTSNYNPSKEYDDKYGDW